MSNIPRTIHFCWFGGEEFSKLAKKCMDSWRELCPDYEIKRWDETNFNVYCNPYVEQAYRTKNWAFVSDYTRLKALYKEGGLYMDTDVEVLRSLDVFLSNRAFIGFESDSTLNTGLIGAEKEHPWIKLLLESYEERTFMKKDGKMDMTPNSIYITEQMIERGLIRDGSRQMLPDSLAVFPQTYFCPKSWVTGKTVISANTYALHHFEGAWLSRCEKSVLKCKQIVRRYYGKFFMHKWIK